MAHLMSFCVTSPPNVALAHRFCAAMFVAISRPRRFVNYDQIHLDRMNRMNRMKFGIYTRRGRRAGSLQSRVRPSRLQGGQYGGFLFGGDAGAQGAVGGPGL